MYRIETTAGTYLAATMEQAMRRLATADRELHGVYWCGSEWVGSVTRLDSW